MQETSEVPNEGMHEPNDWVGENIKPTVIENGDHEGIIEGEERVVMEEREENAAGTNCTTHISNSINGGGVQHEVSIELNEMNENSQTCGMVEKEGCEKKEGPKKSKKLKKRKGGLDQKNKKEKKEKKGKKVKKRETHSQSDDENLCEDQNSGTMSQPQSRGAEGVVRSLPNQFAPCASLSNNGIGSSSHVESVGDSGIMMGNNKYEQAMEKLQAEKLWYLAKEKLGVTAEGADELYIEMIKEMEERDNHVKGRKGKKQSSK